MLFCLLYVASYKLIFVLLLYIHMAAILQYKIMSIVCYKETIIIKIKTYATYRLLILFTFLSMSVDAQSYIYSCLIALLILEKKKKDKFLLIDWLSVFISLSLIFISFLASFVAIENILTISYFILTLWKLLSVLLWLYHVKQIKSPNF